MGTNLPSPVSPATGVPASCAVGAQLSKPVRDCARGFLGQVLKVTATHRISLNRTSLLPDSRQNGLSAAHRPGNEAQLPTSGKCREHLPSGLGCPRLLMQSKGLGGDKEPPEVGSSVTH